MKSIRLLLAVAIPVGIALWLGGLSDRITFPYSASIGLVIVVISIIGGGIINWRQGEAAKIALISLVAAVAALAWLALTSEDMSLGEGLLLGAMAYLGLLGGTITMLVSLILSLIRPNKV